MKKQDEPIVTSDERSKKRNCGTLRREKNFVTYSRERLSMSLKETSQNGCAHAKQADRLLHGAQGQRIRALATYIEPFEPIDGSKVKLILVDAPAFDDNRPVIKSCWRFGSHV